MSKFDRKWTMELPVEKDRFMQAFHMVVEKDTGSGYIVIPLLNKPGKHFFGRIFDQRFYIQKRRGMFEWRVSDVKGKMITGQHGLSLELQMQSILLFNFFSLFGMAIPFTLLGFFLLTGLINLFDTIPNSFGNIYPFIAIPLVFTIVMYVQVKLIHAWQNYLQRLYTTTIRKIEAHAMQ